MDSPALLLSNEIAALVERTALSVVAVNGRRRTHSSGVHWRQGLIVTAEHSVRRDEEITVTLPDGTSAGAALLGRDPGTDIALLKADTGATPPAVIADGAAHRVGDLALVVGRSPNSGPNASTGIISAVSGPWRTWRGGALDAYIRLGAEVFAGSSGGAVVDYRGAVIGIATSALSRVAGLAVPASSVNRIVDILLTHGSMPKSYLGVGLQPVPIPASFRKKLSITPEQGIMVLDVEQEGPADKGGILIGDIVFEIEGKNASSIEDVQSLIGARKAGTAVRLRIIRGGELRNITLTVGERTRRNQP